MRSPDGKRVMVIVHGYGAGLGFWWKNYMGLSGVPGWRVYALDWLGMGRSSRTPLPKRIKNAHEHLVRCYFLSENYADNNDR